MSTITVPFTVMKDSGITENYDTQQGASATVTFRCLWDDHYTLVQELTGTATLRVSAGGTKPSIIAEYPCSYPGSPNLLCRKIDRVVPFGKPKILSWLPAGKWLAAQEALVTATFTYFPIQGQGQDGGNPQDGQFDASGKPWVTTSVQLSSDTATWPEHSLQFSQPSGAVGPPQPFNGSLLQIVPIAQITMKRQLLPYIPVMEMLTLLGKLNNAPMVLGNYTCAAGTVMFLGGNTEVTCNTDGTVVQTVDYTFQFRPYPWNQVINPSSGQWQNVVSAKDGKTPPYASADFSILP